MKVFIFASARRFALGLREMKKSRTRAAIEAAAVSCLTETGYRGMKMSDVARMAEVAVGTLYNYFPSKAALVSAVTQLQVMEALERSQDLLDHGVSCPADALLPPLGEVIRMMSDFGKALMREVFSASMRAAGDELGREMMKADMMVVSALAERAGKLQTRGMLGTAHSPDKIALLVYSTAMGLILMYIFDDDLEVEWLLAEVDLAVTALLRGLNE